MASSTGPDVPTSGDDLPVVLAGEVDVFDLVTMGMVVTDRAGCVRRVNPAFARLVGRDRADLIGLPLTSLVTADHHETTLATMHDLVTKSAETATFDTCYVRPDGSDVLVEVSVRSLVDAAGQVTGVLSQAVDISARVRDERGDTAVSHRFEDPRHVTGMGSFVYDPAKDSVRLSDDLGRLLVLPASRAIELKTLMELVHPDDRANVAVAVSECMDTGAPLDISYRFLLPHGRLLWVKARAEKSAGQGSTSIIVGSAVDITDLKSAQERLVFQSFHDNLTGLANRRLFLDRVEDAVRQKERWSDQLAVLVMDVDDFKTVNDSVGHPAGDRLLIALAVRLAAVTREGDTLARLGGDEFGVLAEAGPMPQTAKKIARNVLNALRAPFELDGQWITVHVSIGIAIGRRGHDSCEELLRDADLAMYLAKRNGDRYEIGRPGMRDDAVDRLSILSDLRHGLDNGQFEVFYQPIVNTQTANPEGAEALLRWHHTERGMVPPADFIGLAESNGLINRLGGFVTHHACRQAQLWRHMGVVDEDFAVSVNLSARELAEPSLVDAIELALKRSGLPPANLILEVTETSMIEDSEVGLARLLALKGLGVRISLDDYGIGYSSLSRLSKLPIDIVKIDKTFIDGVTVNPARRALVKSVVDVSRALGLTCVAEGVEHREQQEVLQGLGCDQLQGFLFAKPLPPAAAARALQGLRRNAARLARAERGPQVEEPVATAT